MHPEAHSVWKAPRWALAVLLACLGSLGPFAVDTYIPAFAGIAASVGASPLQMQQTLSAYLAGFAFMNLFHGAFADSFGRRPVVLAGVALFTLASIGCALAEHIGWLVFWRGVQGMSTGAGIVISRAVIRDLFPPAEAQKMMSQVTIFFGAAPAIAPILGGYLYVHLDWHAIFWALAAIGAALLLAVTRLLPETLHASQRQPFNLTSLFRGYREIGTDRRFMLLAFASGVPFNGMFLYVLSAPEFLGTHLRLAPTQFFWFFLCTIGGIMAGAWLSGRLAGRIQPRRQIRAGFAVMTLVAIANLLYNELFEASVPWALAPIAILAFGWALMTPVVMLLVLEIFPQRRGLASSLQAVVGSAANAIVAGVVAPLVMHSTLALAWASLVMTGIGLAAWLIVKQQVRDIAAVVPKLG
jgi:DHA1 family bicyclomycin/chloramphenicol resistance-like MFS transporter